LNRTKRENDILVGFVGIVSLVIDGLKVERVLNMNLAKVDAANSRRLKISAPRIRHNEDPTLDPKTKDKKIQS